MKNIDWSRIGKTLGNSIDAIARGELLIRLRFNKYFVHIIWFFFLFTIMIWANVKIESTLLIMQRNKTTIENLKIFHGKTVCDLEKMKRINTIEDLLEQKGSKVGIPEKPADILK